MHQDPLYPYGQYPDAPKEDKTEKAMPTKESSIGKPLEEREEHVKVAVEGLQRLLSEGPHFTEPPVRPSIISSLPVVVPPSFSLSYHVTTPIEERRGTPPSDALFSHPFSPPEREPTQSRSGMPDPSLTLTIPPRVADYSAGNLRGPYHQPILHNEPCGPHLHQSTWGLPPEVFMAALNSQGRKSLWPPRPRCFYCTQRTHLSTNCPQPHVCCARGQRCIVPLRHPNFSILCQYGASHQKWQDQRGKARSPAPLITLDPQLQVVLAEDHFDAESDEEHAAKGEPLTPFDLGAEFERYMTPSPDFDKELQRCSIPSPIQCTEYWDAPLPSYVPPTEQELKAQQQPSWWEADDGWDTSTLPHEWGGSHDDDGSSHLRGG